MSLPTIKKGSTGDAVKYCQERLTAKGWHLTADGVFGNLTDAAVREFQASENLVADGVVGEKTWNRLLSEGQVKPPEDLLKDKKNELMDKIPQGTPESVRKTLVTAISYLGEQEEPYGSNDGPGIHELVKYYNQYWWRIQKDADGNTIPEYLEAAKKRGYPLESECTHPQAWCSMACMSWIRIALDLGEWDYKAGFATPLVGHPFEKFLGNGGQVEDWAKNHDSWTSWPEADAPAPAGAVATIGGDKANSDTVNAQHVLMIVCDNGDGSVTTIEGNVSNGVGSYRRWKKDLRGWAIWW